MKTFIYKNTTNDEVVYIDITSSFKFECGHYYSGLHLCGSRFYGKSDTPSYEDMRTVMSQEDMNTLFALDKEIEELGYGLDKDPEKLAKGQAICDKAKKLIFDTLKTEENDLLFKSIIEEEKEAMMNEKGLSQEDVDYIFDNYNDDYQDREIVNGIYDSTYDLGYEEAWELGYVNRNDSTIERYFDFEKFGEDLLEDDNYLELPSGKIASLCY